MIKPSRDAITVGADMFYLRSDNNGFPVLVLGVRPGGLVEVRTETGREFDVRPEELYASDPRATPADV